MSKDLTTSEIDRQNILNNRFALAEIEKAAGIQGIPFEGKTVVLKEQVAAFFEVTPRTVDNYLEKFGPELARNGYVVLKVKRLKTMKLAIQAQDVHEADFVNISKVPQLGVFDIRAFLNLAMLMTESHRAASGCKEFTKKLVNRVDAAPFHGLVFPSRPAGPLLSLRRVKHTSAGIFLPRSHHEPKGVAA
jgi:hypothetical protein